MTIYIATLCDSAADYSGKLCVLGAFDTLCAREFPVVHPQCSLAIRIGYEQGDVGRHEMLIRCLDPDGVECLPPFNPVIDVGFPSPFMPFVTRNLVLNLQRVKFERSGKTKTKVAVYAARDWTALDVQFGCTGGQHRSVYFAERLATTLRGYRPDVRVVVTHRERAKWPARATSSAGPAAEPTAGPASAAPSVPGSR